MFSLEVRAQTLEADREAFLMLCGLILIDPPLQYGICILPRGREKGRGQFFLVNRGCGFI